MMKNENGWKKWCRGSVGIGLAAAVIAVVLLLNIGMTALSGARLWYVDLTPDSKYMIYPNNVSTAKYSSMYRLMDETVNYLGDIFADAKTERGGEPVKVEIIFCADPDVLTSSAMMRYVYYTALQLQKRFPETISVSTRDVWSNPSSVDMYRSTAYSTIYQSNVIIASGTEYRVATLRSFYTYDSDSESNEPAAYSGEKQFVKQILAVTRAEAPICCLTVNHGEPFATLPLNDRESWGDYRRFVELIEGAGYEVRYLDLAKEEIPENCRLLITLDPQTDFVSSFDDDSVRSSESEKLDRYLDQSYSYLVLVDADTPELPNLEEYLELWGIRFSRYKEGGTEGNYRVSDTSQALNGDGTVFMGQYAAGGMGYSMLSDIHNAGVAPKVVFGNAMPIAYSSTYRTSYMMANEEKGTGAYTYGSYDKNSWIRTIVEMFHAGTDSSMAKTFAVRDGEILKDAEGVPIGGSGRYNLMTISAESRVVGEGQGWTSVNDATYVCAIGSTEFVSDAVLSTTAYGNTDILLAVLRGIGQEVVPVGLSYLKLYDPAIGADYYTDAGARTTTIVFALIPAVVFGVTGAVVLIRRKLRH